MRRLAVLHSNDIHGRDDGLARIATLVERVRAAEASRAAVLYVDVGDVEDTTNRLSNFTKGVSSHRLLRAAGCRAVAVGNGAVIRYGVEPLVEQRAASGYPHLAANLLRDGRIVPGVDARAVLDLEGVRVGLIGLTPTTWRDIYEDAFGLELPEEAPLVREHSVALRAEGADIVILLSHQGLDSDRELAPRVADVVDLILGAHSHTLLPDGERVGGVTIAHAGEFGEHLGRVDVEIAGGVTVASVRVEPVGHLAQHPAVLGEREAVERELEDWLSEVVGHVDEELDVAYDRECGATAFMADVVRERMAADVALTICGTSFLHPLPAGPLTRRMLYEACPSPGVSSVTTMTGAQLEQLVRRGNDLEFALEVPHSFRGQPRGLMHLSGAELRDGRLLVGGEPVDPARLYRVAATDYELGTYGGYAEPDWALEIEYDGTTIMREAVEEHLRRHGQAHRPGARIVGTL